MIFSWDMAERLQCSEKKKTDVVGVISDIVDASEKARREGLLALEEEIEGYRNPLLRLGRQGYYRKTRGVRNFSNRS